MRCIENVFGINRLSDMTIRRELNGVTERLRELQSQIEGFTSFACRTKTGTLKKVVIV